MWLSSAKTAEPSEMPFGGQGTMCYMGVAMGATWRMRLNDPCWAAMQPVTAVTLATF